MAFTLKIRNFGKLSDAEIRIGQLTVFAGPNSTGKSSVSKLLYSLFDGMNANHVSAHFNNLVHPLQNDLRKFALKSLGSTRRSLLDIGNDEENLLPSLRLFASEIELMKRRVADYSDNIKEVQKVIEALLSSAEKMKDDCRPLEAEIKQAIQEKRLDSKLNFDGMLTGMEKTIGTLIDALSKTDSALDFITSGIEFKILQNLFTNFQVSDLSSLRKDAGNDSEIVIDNVGIFRIQNGNHVHFEIESSGLQQLQEYSRVIYLESPIYWKLKSALEDIQSAPRFFHSPSEQRISGVPGYFYDLSRVLRSEYIGDIAFPELYKKLTSAEVLSGKMTIAETGELNFLENDRSFSLHLTAMGVVNLGILALLIERKIIGKGSFLFIDEPEAHLHPAWQVVMAEALFELAKGGVNVVIATHSVDILKWLEVHVKKNPGDEGIIALNKFPVDRSENEGWNFDDKMAAIKQELTKPFADLYMEGL